ncbi:spike base protein, RCAP_Rcc01079 family [Oceanicella actignis]|uniref:Uncharacterized protein n=1 Tax=Oceanicella actignis TaxID=1189325 RepID=A0A1M7U2X7_9RHOB|nr:hypothetical protein [Oceanicella actignis]TYO84975.1 hypothetical protein LY05_02687 [Oceanicella actignis]SET86804.1 hypothetical protein SAMN04488119_11330 [Oceanicella actignis]SHN77200.1 hypothetical protein SAMN05216200_1152 [Oceanicella actignis]
MANPFSGRAVPLAGPATDIVPVTPDDAVDLPDAAIALFVTVGGDVVIDTVRGGGPRTVTVADQTLLPVGVTRVRATGTTAAGIHALVID